MSHVVVVGPGSLGTLFGVRLIEAGHDVTMACRTREAAKQVQAQGLHLEAKDGTFRTDITTATKPSQVKGDIDAVVLATKCQAAEATAKTWRPKDPAVPLIGLHNGLLGSRLQQIGGVGYVPCTVGFPASWNGAGRSIQTGHGDLHLGTWPAGPLTAPLERAADLLVDVAPVRVTTNMEGVAWTKLLVNSAGMVGALTGQPLGELLKDRRARDAFIHIAEEGHQAGLAEGIHFERVSGFHPHVLATLGKAGRPVQRAVVGLIGRKYRRMRSSSLQGLQRGDRTEVDHLNGVILQTAQHHRLEAPVNAALVNTVHAIEAGSLRPSPDLLSHLPV